MQKKFVAVIGYRNSGKSTIVQSLTGCNNRSFIGYVEDKEANLSIFVHSTSPQEHPATNQAAFDRYLRNAKEKANLQGLVFAIQPTKPRRRLLMETMFNLAKQRGFECYAFILQPPYKNGEVMKFDEIRDRVLSGDSTAKIFALDARRFAVLNAEAIRSISRLPY